MIDQFRGESQFKTWLFSIAKRVFLTSVRRHKVEEINLEVFDFLDRTADQVSQLEKEELLAHGLSVIFSLPEPMKSVFLARIYTEDSYEKIAADVGISLSSAKVLVHRARKTLKKRLKEDYGYDL